jgi:hypothetical protein
MNDRICVLGTHTVRGDKLTPPVQLPFGVIVIDGVDGYTAVVGVEADNAVDALEAARAILADFLGCPWRFVNTPSLNLAMPLTMCSS